MKNENNVGTRVVENEKIRRRLSVLVEVFENSVIKQDVIIQYMQVLEVIEEFKGKSFNSIYTFLEDVCENSKDKELEGVVNLMRIFFEMVEGKVASKYLRDEEWCCYDLLNDGIETHPVGYVLGLFRKRLKELKESKKFHLKE